MEDGAAVAAPFPFRFLACDVTRVDGDRDLANDGDLVHRPADHGPDERGHGGGSGAATLPPFCQDSAVLGLPDSLSSGPRNP